MRVSFATTENLYATILHQVGPPSQRCCEASLPREVMEADGAHDRRVT